MKADLKKVKYTIVSVNEASALLETKVTYSDFKYWFNSQATVSVLSALGGFFRSLSLISEFFRAAIDKAIKQW